MRHLVVMVGVAALAVACDDSSDEAAAADAQVSADAHMGGGMADAMVGALPDASTPDAEPMGPDAFVGMAESCEAASGDPCFTNADCAPERICLDIGEFEGEVVCCVPGTRGEVATGEACDAAEGQRQCASTLCVEQAGGEAWCSGLCETDEDCPATLPDCTPLAFAPEGTQICLPASGG